MAQSALTVTPENPTPPTNFSSVGAFPPNPPNLTRQTYNDPKNWSATNPKDFPPPFFDDGVPQPTAAFGSINEVAASVSMPASCLTFAANTAALASGTSAADNAGGTLGPGAGGTGVNNAVGTFPGATSGLVPASTSVADEGAGTETLFTQTYNPVVLTPIPLKAVGCGPNMPAIVAGGPPPNPNQAHASSLSPGTNPTLTSITPGSTVSGVGTTTLTATGVGFTRQSQIVVNGVPQLTVFASSTSLTCAAVTKKATAGPWPVTVVTGGAVVTAAQTWTFT